MSVKRWLSAPAAPMKLVLTAVLLAAAGEAAAARHPRAVASPFDVIDEQRWVNPDRMTWDDFKAPPGTAWNDSSRRGSVRNFNIALLAVDYEDKAFVVTGPPNSTIFGNPQPAAANMARDRVPAFYRDLLNRPGALNRGHTLHEYWMGDSGGRFGVDLAAFGVYRLPALSFQYGIDGYMNPGACPPGATCDVSLREDALAMWRRDVGDGVAGSYELVFVLSAGQDESSTWQEFGEMKFAAKDDVPAAFGPPRGPRGEPPGLPNYARTRYVEWTSWAAASTIWPNAGDGSSIQCESSGMGTYAHELSHLLNIGDNYGNPYGKPLRRDYTGSWSMLSRGSFNGPGGPHTRWQIPSLQGGSMGSLHTVRDKFQLKLMADAGLHRVSQAALAASGPAVARITARAVESDVVGLRVELGTDLSPRCDVATDVFCDGGGYDNYDVEVVDRMGADSFQPDSGVMISKSKNSDRRQPFQWTIDANPHDIDLVDFVRPDGRPAMATMGDYRQLADALFHAGTRSGSEYEYVDAPNGLHFYVVDKHRDAAGVLSYTVGVRSLNATARGGGGARLSPGRPVAGERNSPTGTGVLCAFELTHEEARGAAADQPRAAPLLGADIYRLRASVEGAGWRVEVRNALATARPGETVAVAVAVGASVGAAPTGTVTLTAVSETDPTVKAEARCSVARG